jgi:hypothetical protein
LLLGIVAVVGITDGVVRNGWQGHLVMPMLVPLILAFLLPFSSTTYKMWWYRFRQKAKSASTSKRPTLLRSQSRTVA